MSLAGKTVLITGASRGIGRAIALRVARDGANVVIAAKTAEPHPKLAGTIYSVADEVASAGGKPLPVVVDVRDEASVGEAVRQAVEQFGGIDICLNNASAIQLTGTLETDMKRFDLMHSINSRGTFLVSKLCLPHLLEAANPHVLNIAPPLAMEPRWFGPHVAYSIAKYGMSLCVLGMAEEFRDRGVAFNALWPRTIVSTAAIEFNSGVGFMAQGRSPEIMADAAYAIFNRDARSCTGNFFLDDAVLYDEGERDFDRYRIDPSQPLRPDLFLPEDGVPPPGVELGERM